VHDAARPGTAVSGAGRHEDARGARRATRPHITVVGLGPAGEDLIPARTREILASATNVFLRTARHPAASVLAGRRSWVPRGAEVVAFDHHYDEADSFDDVYDRIVADLVAASEVVATAGQGIVYALPGSPLVAERTVELLRADVRVELTVVPALSFLDLAWARLGVDPLASGVRLVDGTRFASEAAGERGPLLVAQCWSPSVLSEVKLALGDCEVPSDVGVTVLHHLGLPDETVAVVPWHELDRAVVCDHLTSLWVPRLAAPVARELASLDELVRRLRRDCPWDRQQTHASLEPHLVEEAYEVLEAIDALVEVLDADDPVAAPPGETALQRTTRHLEEELGDLLFQVLLHSRLAAEEGWFTIADVARTLQDKLVSRHPHVFGDAPAHDAAAVVANWEHMKKQEKGRESVTDGIPPALPALALAAKLQRKSEGVPGAALPSDEVLRARARNLLGALEAGDTARGELPGELLWAVADLVRRGGTDPEDALRVAARRRMEAIRDAERRARG